jgi:hypothetical protein
MIPRAPSGALRGSFTIVPAGTAPETRLLLAARGLRAIGDGLVSLLLPVYLLVVGYGAFETGVIATATLAGSEGCSGRRDRIRTAPRGQEGWLGPLRRCNSGLRSDEPVEPVGSRPADRLHEGFNIGRGLGAEVDVVGVLVHVEGQIGCPPASVVVWSAAHWSTSLPSRGDQVSRTQPEPPPSALPIAVNSARQRSKLPKSWARASTSSEPGSLSSPRPSKNTSCRIIEFIATSCSRLRPFTTKPGAVAKSRPASCSSIKFRRFADLKSIGPEGQVAAIRYCGDTYEVTTVAGKTIPFWEFNLRSRRIRARRDRRRDGLPCCRPA